ncbi:uncharacterized protein LOC113113564 isoform X2 [Carassius auratus]|uniref:Uncharacterized protein LOC113113564 isoform X2 n=1 Tax=Carassius auratus TaxID=7957 RepID=A0A6P6QR76_CARAU|nr:uncharacterized protein LOC113113564 isoform X2 [Carassius auratus]
MAFGDLIMIFTAVLISNRASVCKAENAVSVQTGSSVQLDIQPDKLLPFNTLVWMNHESENIVTFIKKTIETEIINGAVFNESTFSLTLKNIQKTDSGLYTAKIFGSNNINVAKYRVSVIDENQQTTGDNNSYFPLHWLIVIVISASLLILVATTLIYSSYKKNDKGVPQNDSTIYAQVQPKSKVQRPLEMLEKSANPQTVYGFTQEHRHPHNTSQTMSSSEIPVETQKNNHPRTTYSTIGPPKTSLYTETDQTVYSVVCKSSNGKMPVY